MTVRRRRDAKPDPAGEPLATRLLQAPQLADPERAYRHVEDWLRSLARSATGRALKQLVAGRPVVRKLLEGLADGSPFLWDLASREPERLLVLLRSDPDARLVALLTETIPSVHRAADEADAMRQLRHMKSEAALLVALADIGGAWPLPRVTQALTQVADAVITGALRFLLTAAAAQGKFTPAEAARPETGSGYFVLAMGKMGGFELNYSSDIDLIVLFDPEGPGLAADVEAAPFYIRLTRVLVRMLQERTADGYVFRVDLRLRPDPGLTQIALSAPAALGYYESVGLNWERAALIKARPCAGDVPAGEAFLKNLAPFIWRKYLDFVAIADVHAMKRQIHAYRGHDEIAVQGHNIKLGRGGIREIEFFVQTQQLIAGGRNPALRSRETLPMLEALAKGGWIDTTAWRELDAAYRFLRTVEHRLQMVADEQTHTLPNDSEALERFARFLGFADRASFAAVLTEHLRNVQSHYAKLFEHAPARGRPQLSFRAAGSAGFKRPLEISAAVRRWFAGSYPALKGELARSHLQELVPLFIDRFAHAEDPDAAVMALDRFLAGLHGGARLLSLLRQNRDLVALIALVLGTAPRLADILAQHPQALDAVIDPAFFGALPDEASLAASLDRSLAEARSYEDLLDRARLFRQEQLFLVGTRILSGTISAQQAGEAFARLADVVIRTLHAAIEQRFAQAHGRMREQQTALIAMGKLGGREMTAGSDLDLILIYDFDLREPESDGARPLYGAQYFARLTQRVIAALTAQTNYGALYPVDMRLRPSGRSGPVATHLESFDHYQHREALTWEHMALTRARVVSGPSVFVARIEAVIRDVLCQPRKPAAIAADVVEMRGAIAKEKNDEDRWDLKYVRGGLVDIEFIAQFLQLIHAAETPDVLDTSTARVLDKAGQLGILAAKDAEVLRPAVRLYHDLTQVLRLCLPGRFDPQAAGAELRGLLARAADVPDFATLAAHLAETQRRVRASFVRILGSAP